jgi:hypothetical protein
MAMRETLEVINRMVAEGIIGGYAIGGAVAALNYIELASTEDLDIFVSFDDMPGKSGPGLITLAPILSFLARSGYTEFHKEGIVVEGWPVQFLPVASDLDAEALARARNIRLDAVLGNVPTRVLLPEHLIANALRVGRAKDYLRIVQFLEEKAVDLTALRQLLERHDLKAIWRTFCRNTGLIDPLSL